MKKLICFILCVLMLIPTVSAAGEMELLVSQVSGKVGDTITIVGQVTNAPSCSSYRVIMTYDGSCLQALSGTKGSGKGFFDEIYPAGAGFHGCLDDRPLLHFRDAAGHTDHHSGLDQRIADDLFQKLGEHFFRHLIVGNDALTEGPHGDDIAGGPAQHVPGSRTYLKHLAGVLINGHHGRFPEDHTSTLAVPKSIPRSLDNLRFFSILSFLFLG